MKTVYLIWAFQETETTKTVLWKVEDSIQYSAQEALNHLRGEEYNGNPNADCLATILVDGVIDRQEWLSLLAAE